MGGWAYRGVIEGFYGRPWSWDERVEVLRWCHDRGMTDYLYAPKDDPLHRERWRTPYGRDVLDGFERLLGTGTLRVGFALSPGLTMDYGSADDRAALAAKVDQVVAVGVEVICLAVDDIDVRPGLGEDHAAVTTWLADHLGDRATLLLVPTEYAGTGSSPYLDALARGVPEAVPIGWTGPAVVCDRITRADAEARAAALGGRPPFLWDNYPVNDALMADRLFLGPLRGRDPDLGEVCAGYASNPMVQPSSSRPALASIAGYLRGEDPGAAWSEAVDELGVRVFAEACDGGRPNELVDRLVLADGPDERSAALAALSAWLRAAAKDPVALPTLEVEPWVDQMRAEARVGRAAVRLIEAAEAAEDDAVAAAAVVAHAMAVAALWPAARRGGPSVMGPRCSFRPKLDHRPDGAWRLLPGSFDLDGNAIDRLVRHALDVATGTVPGS